MRTCCVKSADCENIHEGSACLVGKMWPAVEQNKENRQRRDRVAMFSRVSGIRLDSHDL